MADEELWMKTEDEPVLDQLRRRTSSSAIAERPRCRVR